LIAIDQRVPEESTVRKLARRLGAEVVQEITWVVPEKAQRETRPLALSRTDRPRDLKDTRASNRRTDGAGDEARRARWEADRPLCQRGTAIGAPDQGCSAWPWCSGEAQGSDEALTFGWLH
jgi:hypothetical protein